MKTNGYYIMAFASTHHAIRIEGQLKQRELEGEMIPTPREIDASCGLSLKFPGYNFERVKELVDTSENKASLYKMVSAKGKVIYVKQEM